MDFTLVSGDADLRISVAIDLWRNTIKGIAKGVLHKPPPEVLADKVISAAMSAILPISGLLKGNDELPDGEKLHKVTSASLAGMLVQNGYKTTLSSGKFDQYWVQVGQVRTLIGARICSDKLNHCGALDLIHVRPTPTGATPAIINRFNAEEWFVKAFPVEGDRLLLSLEVPVFDGLSQTDLLRYLDVWDGTVSGFDEFVAKWAN